MIRLRRRAATLAALASIAATVSCSTSNSPSHSDNSGTATGPKQSAALPKVPCPPLDKTAIDPNGSFTWTYTVANTSFDPDKITTSNSDMYLYPVYDSLTFLTATGEVKPMLAKDWTISPDGKSITMHLIKNWTYQDGTPFDAASVKANLDRHRARGTFNEEELASISDVQVVDSSTVKIDTSTGASPLLAILADSAGMMMSPKVFNDPSQTTHPTGGSGAFRVTDYEPASKVVYTAVPHYWDPDGNYLKQMTFLISSDDNARLNGVITGQSDATFLRSSMYKAAKASGMVVCQVPSQQAFMIELNTAKSPFDKPEVRQAINYAIDREAIAQLMNGLLSPGVQLYTSDYWAADPTLTADKYPHDIAKARELLKKAGLPNGFSFTLENNNLAEYQQVAELIQANLAEVGIKMKIVPLELPKLTSDFSVDKTSSAALIQEKATPDPSIAIGAFLLKDGFNNPGGYDNPAIAKLASVAVSAKTSEERAAKYRELFAATYQDAAGPIVLGQVTAPMILRKNIMGFQSWFDGQRKFRGVAIRK